MKKIFLLLLLILTSKQLVLSQSRLVIENLKTGKKFTYPSKASLSIQLKNQPNKWLSGKITNLDQGSVSINHFITPDSSKQEIEKLSQIELIDIKAFSPQWNSRRPLFNFKKIVIGAAMFVFVAPLSLNDKYGTNWLNLAGYGTGGALLFAWGLLDNKRLDKKTQDFSAKYYKFYIKN